MKIKVNKFELILLASRRAKEINKVKKKNKNIFDKKETILALRSIYLNL